MPIANLAWSKPSATRTLDRPVPTERGVEVLDIAAITGEWENGERDMPGPVAQLQDLDGQALPRLGKAAGRCT